MDKLPQQTPDITQQNIDRIAVLFPSAITETKDADGNLKKAINFTTLKQLLSADVVDGDECYEFTWVGKKQSIIEGNRPIRKTLRPAKDESKNWDSTENLYIEGDNLEVLKLLQNSYLNSIKMIYIDPPYNTGNDFVYRDNFAVSKEDYEGDLGVYDEEENRLFKNTESNGRYHSDWCSMMYPRLQLGRNLLSDDGVIFISIDDNEVDNLRKICDEVFGESNFIANFIVIRSEGGGLAKQAVIGHDYVLVFSKNIQKFKPLGKPKDIRGKIVQKNGEDYWIETDWLRKEFGKYGTCPYEEIEKFLGINKKNEIDEGLKKGNYLLVKKENYNIVGRFRKVSEDTSKFYTILKHLNKNGVIDLTNLGLGNYFDFPKPVSLLKELILGSTILNKNEGNFILDFNSGSATTAHAVMQLNAEDGGNRKFIMVQLPEKTDEKSEAYKAGYKTICEIGKERIRRAGKKIEEKLQAKSKDGGLFSEKEDVKTVDTGFRVLKLDDTNMKDVYYSAGEYSQQMLLDLESNIKEDRTDLDLLFGVMLDWGVPLSLPHITEIVGGKQVHFVNDTDLVACFEENINETVVREIAKRKPLRVVFRDSSFGSSPEKINVSEIFKTLSGDTTIKVI